MGRVEENNCIADVICEHTRDGAIIPLKVRILDLDGEYHIYQIRAYKELSGRSQFVMPNSTSATGYIKSFECKVNVFNEEKRIRLFYNAYDNVWKISYIR